MTGATVLDPGTASLIMFGVFFALLALRVPVAFALGLACLPIFVIEDRLTPQTWCRRRSTPTTRSSCWRCRSSC
jgi:hypothetical protein